MSLTVFSAHATAMQTSLVQVEACFMRGFVGLQLTSPVSEVCRSGIERVKASLEACSFSIPAKKIALSLSPADIKMEGSQCDLAFAVVLAWLFSGQDPKRDPRKWLFAAELALSGRLQATKNIIAFAMEALENGFLGIIIAKENLSEVKALTKLAKNCSPNFKALAFSNLEEVLAWFLKGEETSFALSKELCQEEDLSFEKNENFDDMTLTKELEELALTVAVGGHSLLLSGSPGTGKSMFLSRIISIMPEMNAKTHLEALRIHSSSSQKISRELLAGRPPFRVPHHQGTVAAILGIPEQAGELSLAHGGILFLDELAEYRRDLLEGLREPLESGQVRVVRARAKAVWQAKSILLAASNLCPCGWYGSQKKPCRCRLQNILNYRRKLSGPILDRIDLHVNLFEAKREEEFFLSTKKGQQISQAEKLYQKVLAVKKFSKKRNLRLNILNNSDLPAKNLLEACSIEEEKLNFLLKSCKTQTMSKRALIRSLRVARTLADLDFEEAVSERHLKQAFLWQQEEAARQRGDEALGLL